MKAQKFIIFGLFLSFAILVNSACTKQNEVVSASPKTETETAIVVENPSEAQINRAQAVVEKFPDLSSSYVGLAAAYIHSARETGDFSLNSKAETAVKRALEIEPANLNALKLQTSLHLTFHRFAEGREAALKLQKDNPNDAFIYGALTDANAELGNYSEAIEAVQKMVDLRPNMESYARVSHVRSLHGDTAGAIDAMSLAAKIADPQDREAQAWCLTYLGNEYLKAGRYAEAEKSYDTALETFPNYHYALTGKGQTRAALGDYETAVKYLEQAQTRIPLTETVIQLGDVYAKTGNQEKAKQQYDLAEVTEQRFSNIAQRRLALLWADQNIKLDEALAIAKREHEARKDIYTADILAWCLFKKGNLAEAKTAMNEAFRTKNKEAKFYYHAGMIEKGLNNKKEAKRLLQLALKTSPAFDTLQAETAKAALAELK